MARSTIFLTVATSVVRWNAVRAEMTAYQHDVF